MESNFIDFVSKVTAAVAITDDLPVEYSAEASRESLRAIAQIGKCLGEERKRAFPDKIMPDADFAAHQKLVGILVRLRAEACQRLIGLNNFEQMTTGTAN